MPLHTPTETELAESRKRQAAQYAKAYHKNDKIRAAALAADEEFADVFAGLTVPLRDGTPAKASDIEAFKRTNDPETGAPTWTVTTADGRKSIFARVEKLAKPEPKAKK